MVQDRPAMLIGSSGHWVASPPLATEERQAVGCVEARGACVAGCTDSWAWCPHRDAACSFHLYSASEAKVHVLYRLIIGHS